MEHVALNFIKSHYKELNVISQIKENTIQRIWGANSDEKLDDIYTYNMPLYKKMVFRFRNTITSPFKNPSPFQFVKQVDPGNQRKFMSYFGIHNNERDLIEFFGWLRCGLGVYDISELQQLNSIEEVYETEMYKLFIQNEIIFFFGINDEYKQKLIDRYNSECIDRYNNLMAEHAKLLAENEELKLAIEHFKKGSNS